MTAVEPGVPLGPGLLSTWFTLPGPQIRTTNRSAIAATIAANAVERVEFSFWWSSIAVFQFVTVTDNRASGS